VVYVPVVVLACGLGGVAVCQPEISYCLERCGDRAGVGGQVPERIGNRARFVTLGSECIELTIPAPIIVASRIPSGRRSAIGGRRCRIPGQMLNVVDVLDHLALAHKAPHYVCFESGPELVLPAVSNVYQFTS
jgi:hypothetical protein